MKKPITHKFNAKRVDIDGFKFPSKKEGAYYNDLKLLQSCGELLFFLRQVPIYLPGGVRLVIDFVEFWADGRVEFTDVKGFNTPMGKMKIRQVEALYPFTIGLK